MNIKFGRLPRRYDPRVPHMSALTAGRLLAAPPPSVDYTAWMPANLGVMMNDTLGDCTCAAIYHALQVWSYNANPPIDTEPDDNVEALYEESCGYVPGNPATDQGGDEQTVLTYVLNNGAPVGTTGGRHRIAAFVEVDPRNTDDVKRAIYNGGLVYIGFNVPSFLEDDNLTAPGSTWFVQPHDREIIGGHAVVLPGYDDNGLKVISWGNYYTMLWEFFAEYVDEVYALADADWIMTTGMSPGGLSLVELEATMAALKAA